MFDDVINDDGAGHETSIFAPGTRVQIVQLPARPEYNNMYGIVIRQRRARVDQYIILFELSDSEIKTLEFHRSHLRVADAKTSHNRVAFNVLTGASDEHDFESKTAHELIEGIVPR